MTSLAPESKIVPYSVLCDSHDEERWLAARKRYLGASEVSTVLGANSHEALIKLWAVKTSRIPADDLSDNEPVFWGHQLEGTIVGGYARRTGRYVLPFGLMLVSLRYPWMSATPDALTTDSAEAASKALLITRTIGHIKTALKKGADTSGLVLALMKATEGWWPLQIKNIGYRSAENWEEGVPTYYRIQCTQEALVYGSWRTTGAALITGQKLAWEDVEVEEDGVLMRQIVNLGRGFMERSIYGDVKPSVDGSLSARRTLEALYPKEKPETLLRLDGDLQQIAEERDVLKEQIAKATKRCDEIDNEIRDALGDAERCLFPDGSGFTYKTTNKKTYTVEASSHRTLLRKKAKGGE